MYSTDEFTNAKYVKTNTITETGLDLGYKKASGTRGKSTINFHVNANAALEQIVSKHGRSFNLKVEEVDGQMISVLVPNKKGILHLNTERYGYIYLPADARKDAPKIDAGHNNVQILLKPVKRNSGRLYGYGLFPREAM